MTVAVVRHAKAGYAATVNTSLTATWVGGGTATPGNALILMASCEQIPPGKLIVLPAGWTELERHHSPQVVIARKVADGSETGATITFNDFGGAPVGDAYASIAVVEVSGEFDSIQLAVNATPTGNPHAVPTVTPDGGIEALLLILAWSEPIYGVTGPPSDYTNVDDITGMGRIQSWQRHLDSTSGGGYSGSFSYEGGVQYDYGHVVFIARPPELVVDFEGSPTAGVAPLTVDFVDLSTPTPSAWAWDFGDGETSTLEDPGHVYASPGTYSPTLVATIGGTDYATTKVDYIEVLADDGYVPPEPGEGIVEIYATVPGGAKWGIAKWGEATWGSSGWQNVTPYVTQVAATWGSSRPELGILGGPDAASWAIATYDPGRVLDPANADGPYYGDLHDGLPVRLRHRSTIVRQGIAESIGYAHGSRTGYFRVQDVIARMANATVPAASTLPDTLYARARAAISAASIVVEVLPDPPAGDPELVAWESADRSVWQWVTDAAQQVLHWPYIDAVGRLGFRAWSDPLYRARQLVSTNLVDLAPVVATNGLYSVIEVRDGDPPYAIITRALTPPPRYGKRVFTRDDKTPNPEDWAAAVLADRALASPRWIPGSLYPLTAADVEYFATIEPNELVTILYPEANPPIAVAGVVVGGDVTVVGKLRSTARWTFTFYTAGAELGPLYADDGSGDWLTRDPAGDAYLVPDV